MTEVEKQFGAVSTGSTLHNFSRDADFPDAESFVNGSKVSVAPTAPEAVSAVGLGAEGALTVASSVELEHDASGVDGAHVPDTVLQISYVTFVATPENVFSGTNVTVVPLNVQVPWSATVSEVVLQLWVSVGLARGTCELLQSFRVELSSATEPCVV